MVTATDMSCGQHMDLIVADINSFTLCRSATDMSCGQHRDPIAIVAVINSLTLCESATDMSCGQHGDLTVAVINSLDKAAT